MNQRLLLIAFSIFSFLLMGCSDEEKINVPAVSGLEAEYSVLQNDAVELKPTVTSDYEVAYSWLLDDKEVASSLEYTFESEVAGEYKLIFRVANKGGTAQKEVSINVIERGAPPAITGLEEKYIIISGEELSIEPTIVSEHEVTYLWLVNEEENGNDETFTFSETDAGTYTVVLRTTNQGGTTEKEFLVVVNPGSSTLNVDVYSILTIELPEYVNTEDEISLDVLESASDLHRLTKDENGNILFAAVDAGNYVLQLTSGDFVVEYEVVVTEREEEVSAHTAYVYDFLPAPGQFVNKIPAYVEGDTHETMLAKVEKAMVGPSASFVSLGGWGGYVEIGFDHTIVNVPGKRDFRVFGNSFAGSAEPGIIMVAYDKNKNGKPDEDEWYEIAGSGNFTANNESWYEDALAAGGNVETYRDYEMTFYRPEVEDTNPVDNYIRWTNNKGEEGYKVKNSFHRQSYYPLWIKEDQITFKGIKLADNGWDRSGSGTYFYLEYYKYGYVDNFPNNDKKSAVDIDWAIDKDGNPANLPGIDFVRVINGIDKENGWLGEASTEVGKGEDLHALGVDIDSELE